MNERLEVLQQRQKTHGSFEENARISQSLKHAFGNESNYHTLSAVHKEALDMIALKLSRILSGQGMRKEHWEDIKGYAALAEEACAE